MEVYALASGRSSGGLLEQAELPVLPDGEPDLRRSGSHVLWRLIEGRPRALDPVAEVPLAGHANALVRMAVRRDASGGLNLGCGQRDEVVDGFPWPARSFLPGRPSPARNEQAGF